MLPFGRPSLFLLFIGVFVLPASGQSCTQLKCTKRGEVCIVADDNQEECTCREAECPFTGEEVCGSDSITYKSRCDLDKTACMLGVNITEAHMGKCGESPILVSNSHRTQQTLTLGKRGKIRCDFTGKYVQVRWQKIAPNGKRLSIGFPRVAYRLNTLRFRRVHKQDAGTYRCIASTGSRNTAKATVKVSVEEPEPMDKTVESYTVCHSVKLVGTGSNYSTRWYFDAKESWKCLPFLYRGSGGNRNNFKNKQTCLKKCAHAAGDVCDLPKDPGPCMAYLQRWHYNTTSGKCDKFIYGGCLGNANNFKTKEECNQRCSASQVCQLKPAAGICLGYFPSYFFNQTSGQCEKFIYGGCLGNSNRFQTMELCQKKCNRQAKVLQDVGEKPGVCPWRRMILIFCGERKDLCESDWSCEGNHKCCFDGCRQTCVKPVLIQKKPGKCPKLTRDECPEDRTGRCAVDGDCPGSRKCCYNGCHSDCVVPERVRRPKPGVCPVEGAIDKKLCKHTKNECKADEDCFGRLKCCFNGCFNECVPLRRSRPKPGKCPVLDGDPPANCPSRTDKCADDSECPGKNKCCFTGCVNKCIAPPPKEKPGECPLADFIPPEMCEDTTDKCKEDDDCPGRAKCCSTGCLSECIVPPIREKPGECPVVDFLPLEQCEDTTDKCSIDDDCPGRGKCCGTGCIKECVIPPLTLPPKKGQCPKPWKGLNGICDRRGDECSDDSSCPGNGKCCDNGCQKECIDPVPVDKPGTCPKPWKGLDGICDRRGDMCDVDIKCRRDEKCCFNGCQRDCVKPAEQTSDKEGRCPKPWKEQPCDRRGDMCSTDKDCYGKSKCCFNGCQKDCSQSVNMTTCQEKRQKALDLITAEEPIVGVPVPKCKPDGSFEDEQCHELYCWCVDSKSGVKIPGTSVRGHASCFAREKPGKCPRPWKGKKGICDYRGDRCLKDDECPGDHRCCFNGCQNDCVPPVGTKLCDKHNKEMTSDAEGGSPLIGAFIPSCKLDGDYEEVQCHASPDYCWCVDKFGNEKPGTRVKGKPACDAKGNQRGAGKAGTCPEPWKGSTGFCDKMGDECGMDFSCPGEEKCCFSGCQRLCVNTTETHKKGGTKPGKCPKPWLGQEGLCNRRGDMCQSDTDCGDEQICCSNGCQKECVAPGLSTCQLRYEQSFMFPRLGRFVPQCKEDGRFAETQCHASTGHCWCVDHYGAEQLGTRTKGRKNCTEPDPCQETNCDFYGECVPSNDRTSVECKCNVACYLVHDPVCGTDGKTYGNECQMKSTACLHKQDIKMAYKGECAEVDACETIDCGYYADCLIVNGTGQCACPRLDCSEDSAHVCGSDGTVYKDECHLMSESCKKGKLITPALPEFCLGPSDPCDNVNCGHPLQKCKVVDGKAVCDCSHILCTREFDPVCGTDGKDYSTECMLRFLSCEAGNIVSVDYKGKCNIGLLLPADKVDPCDKVNCSKPHSICVDANGTAQCQCPFAITLEYFPVCGSDGVVYPNPSSLNIASCNSDGAIFKVQDGECPSFADPCAVSRCSHKRHRCVVKNSTVVCVCNLACTLEYDPVCASNNVTYSNRCSMEVAECELGKRLRVVHKGECGSIEVCPVPWKGKGGICDRRGDMCQTDADCLRGKCCFNGCQNDCIKSIGHVDCGVKCDPNAQCIEFVFGGRRCVCNPGFHGDGKTCSVDLCSTKKCHQYATCAVKDSMAVCVCPLICPAIYLPVCGSDGKVYGNDCQLRVESCTQQKDIFVASKEDCKPDPCEKSKCSHPLHKCIKTSHGASCRCLPAPCTREFIPVCGSDGKSYPNKCVMTQTGCERSQNITKVHDGECAKETNPCDATGLCTHPFHQCVERENNAVCLCPMVVPLIWSPVCGSDGHTYSNSWALKSATCLANRIVKEENKGQCPSLTDPCDFSLCSHKKHFCRVVKGNAECVCREICPLILQPVCGSDGVSYPNLCSLEVESCKTGKSIEVISEGRCDLCAEKKCSHPLHYCKVVDYVATCVCTEICPFLWSPVCGSDGKTYPNNCSLNVAACKTGQDLKIKHTGECSTRPGECPVLNPTPVCRSIIGCDKDEKCPLGERCCLQGDCTRKCVKAEIPPPPPRTRPGVCPVLNPTPVCRSITGCDKDERCPLGERCCLQRDCTRKCVEAAAPPPPQLLRHIRPVSIPTAMCVPPCHPFGNCVKNDAGKYECSCERPCTREYNPVCGTDGKTYSTKCMMKLLVCEQGSDVTVNYRGECKKESCPFEISPCHYPRPVCIMAKGKPTCRCRNICPALLDPVCGSDGVTYDNMCLLERRACLVENSGAPSGSLRYLGNGECTAAQICSLPPEVGRCRAALRRYFFNATSRQCELFKYGGCDGNTNRFDTEEKCQDFCGSLTVCQLDPCPDPYAICTESSAGHRKCACPEACTKDYSPVCGSDGNTYSNECHMQGTACEQGVMIKVKSEGECDNHPGRCPPVDPRPCPEELSDKCFDDASCEPNEKCCYDGCEKACMKPFLRPPPQSFSQRLLSLRESAPDSPSCKPCSKFPNSCEPDRSVEGNCTPVCGTDGREYSTYCQLLAEACKPENAGVLKLRHRGPCVCDLPLAAGPCLGYMPRFFYNSTSKQCEHFVYGGCRGNGNRFHTIEQCENKCISPCKNFNCSSPHAECEVKHGRPVCECRIACTADYRPVCGTDGRTYGNRCALESVACTEERPWLKRRYLGECSNSPNPCTLSLCKSKRHKCVVKDNTAVCVCKPCRKNSYKPVCASNGRDYINECLMEVAACESGEDLTVVHPGKCNICDLPPEPGMCEAYMPNYFFNATSKRCERFIYGGCGGNGNRFTSVKDCQKKCQVCDLPPEPGMCEAYMPQYFFNATSKRCERFIYGGCGGNGNRFTSVKDCQKKCQGEPPSSDDPCQTKKCDYHGICRVTEDGLSTCECSTVCPASYKPVCGSDGKIYSNQCLLKVHACRNRLDIRVVGGPKKCSAKKVRCKACPARSDLLSHFCNNDFVIAGNLTGIQGAEEGYWSTITVSVTDVFKGPSPPQDRMLKIAFTENLNRCYCKEFDLSRSKSNGELIIGGLVSKDSGGMFLDKWSYAHHSTPHLLRKVREITKKARCGTFEELD